MEGLKPRSLPTLHRFAEYDYSRSTYAFLNPQPAEWVNGGFPALWSEFLHTRGNLLLQLSVEQSDSSIVVGDAGYVEGFLYRDHHAQLRIPKEYKLTNPQHAHDLYTRSLIPLQKYLKDRPPYLLPEVQIQRSLTLSEFQVCDQQPILELQIGDGHFPNVMIDPLPEMYKHRDELAPWIAEVSKRKPMLEGSLQRYGELISRPNKEIF